MTAKQMQYKLDMAKKHAENALLALAEVDGTATTEAIEAGKVLVQKIDNVELKVAVGPDKTKAQELREAKLKALLGAAKKAPAAK